MEPYTHTANLMLAVGSVTFSQAFQHVVVIFQENRTPVPSAHAEHRTPDQHDAFSVARWLSPADYDGNLAAFLEARPDPA